MTCLVFLLEEPSARDLIEGLLPRLLPAEPAIEVRYLTFQGKQDLEKNICKKVRGWLQPDSRFVILRDQDAGDCRVVKKTMLDLALESGRPGIADHLLVRVACRELESWVLGDWTAVGEAFEMPRLAEQSRKSIYRDPDKLDRPVEELRKFIPEYQKRDGARRVGPLLDTNRNQSPSFRAFCAGLLTLLQTAS
jgi:hypothetical protein